MEPALPTVRTPFWELHDRRSLASAGDAAAGASRPLTSSLSERMLLRGTFGSMMSGLGRTASVGAFGGVGGKGGVGGVGATHYAAIEGRVRRGYQRMLTPPPGLGPSDLALDETALNNRVQLAEASAARRESAAAEQKVREKEYKDRLLDLKSEVSDDVDGRYGDARYGDGRFALKGEKPNEQLVFRSKTPRAATPLDERYWQERREIWIPPKPLVKGEIPSYLQRPKPPEEQFLVRLEHDRPQSPFSADLLRIAQDSRGLGPLRRRYM